MNINPKKILDDINNKICSRKIFKYNREFLIQSLIEAVTKTQYISFFKSRDMNLVNQIVEQFRTILKFIYSVDNENGDVHKDKSKIINEFSEMLFEFLDKYTPIRNYLDQCILGTREIKYNEEQSKYYEEHYNDYLNYSRTLDKVKEFPSEKLKEKVLDKMGKYLSYNKFKPNVFKDRYLFSLMKDYIEICWLDSEIKFDHDFGDFTYSDLISFCASLKLIADYYSFINSLKPCFSIEYDKMVDGISKLSDLPEEKTKIFLKYQTYDYSYQKDKLTLIQGLIKCNNSFYFFPTTINLGLLPIKMYRLIYDYDRNKYKKDISVIAKKKEEQMTKQIVDALGKYALTIETNYKIVKNKKALAEYDMLIFDNSTNDLYICEFKWHFVGDGEREHKFIDDLLQNEIEHRIEKDKLIIDNPQKICDKLFHGKKVNEVKELLISQNFSGTTEHDMTIIDFETLQWSIGQHDSFKELMAYFFKKEYLKSIPTVSVPLDIEIEGYKFNIYRIKIGL